MSEPHTLWIVMRTISGGPAMPFLWRHTQEEAESTAAQLRSALVEKRIAGVYFIVTMVSDSL